MTLALVILQKRMEATIEIMRYQSGRKINEELRDMISSYSSAISLIDGSEDMLYSSPYYAIMALRRELPSVKQSEDLTNELNNAIKLLKNEDSKKLSK